MVSPWASGIPSPATPVVYSGRVWMPGGESPSSRSSDGLSRIHGEHNSVISTIAAFTTVRCGAPDRSPPPPELPPRSQLWPSLRALRWPHSRPGSGDLHRRPGCRRWPGPSGCGRYWRCRRKGPSSRVISPPGALRTPSRSGRPAASPPRIIRQATAKALGIRGATVSRRGD